MEDHQEVRVLVDEETPVLTLRKTANGYYVDYGNEAVVISLDSSLNEMATGAPVVNPEDIILQFNMDMMGIEYTLPENFSPVVIDIHGVRHQVVSDSTKTIVAIYRVDDTSEKPVESIELSGYNGLFMLVSGFVPAELDNTPPVLH